MSKKALFLVVVLACGLLSACQAPNSCSTLLREDGYSFVQRCEDKDTICYRDGQTKYGVLCSAKAVQNPSRRDVTKSSWF